MQKRRQGHAPPRAIYGNIGESLFMSGGWVGSADYGFRVLSLSVLSLSVRGVRLCQVWRDCARREALRRASLGQVCEGKPGRLSV